MRIEHLSFSFDNQSDFFFKDLSVSFKPHQVHFIQGDNGIGKSTLLAVLQGSIPKQSVCSMRITVDGVTYDTQGSALPDAFLSQVHTVQQRYDRMIADQFTFMQNVRMAHMSRYPGLQQLPEAQLFDIVADLAIDMHKPVYLLSGGQRQLLAIIMALQKTTKVLLLDEPTATLDSHNTNMIIKVLRILAVRLKVTILVICHDTAVVKAHSHGNHYIMSVNDAGNRILHKV